MTDLNKQELRRLAHEASESGVEWLDSDEWRAVMADDWAEYAAAATPAAVIALVDEVEELREEVGGISSVNTMLVSVLKRLTLHARTTGGTAGPDAALMDACEHAEKALSLGGFGRAYMEGADAAMTGEVRENG